jgi:lysophospholipase L1-like esterase
MDTINITVEETIQPINISIEGVILPTLASLSAAGLHTDNTFTGTNVFQTISASEYLGIPTGGSEIYQSDTAPDPNVYPTWLYTVDNTLNIWYEAGQVWVNVSHPKGTPIDQAVAKIAVVGDSIVAAGSEPPASPYFIAQFLGNGWIGHMKSKCGRRIELVKNNIDGSYDHGISGIRADGFMVGGTYRSTFVDALTGQSETIFICVGANDMTVTANATAASNIISLWDEVLATGKNLVGIAIPPTRPPRPSNDEVAWKAAQVSTNVLLEAASKTRRMLYVDYTPSVDLDNDGYLDSICAGDHIHPNICGAARIGEYMATYALPFVSNEVQEEVPAYGSSNWLTPSPFVDGTIAPNSVPTGWVASIAAFPAAVPGYSITRNIIARTDGLSGNLLEVITSGITTTDLRLTAPLVIPQVYIDANGTSLTTSDTLQAYCEVEVVSGSFYNIELSLAAGATRCIDLANNGAMSVSQETSTIPLGTRQLLTTTWTPDTNGSYNLRCHLRFYGNGTIKIGRTGIFKVV